MLDKKYVSNTWGIFDGSCLLTVVLGQFLEPNFQTNFQPCEKCPKQMCGSPRHSSGRSSAEKGSLFCNEHPSFPCLPFRCPNNQHNSETKWVSLKTWQTIKPQYLIWLYHFHVHLHPFIAESHANNETKSFKGRDSPQVGNPNWPDHLDWKAGRIQNHSSSLWRSKQDSVKIQ